MMPYKAQVSNASRLGATRIAVPFERNRRVDVLYAKKILTRGLCDYKQKSSDIDITMTSFMPLMSLLYQVRNLLR